MVERLPVEEKVAGPNPVHHPKKFSLNKDFKLAST